MEALIKAAQIDPRRPDTALTDGAKDSVLLVERALQARGLLSSTYVDGHFGTSTIAAYAAYQRSLGYTGLDATGLPGPSSLRSLGEGRYTVVRAISPGSVVTLRGVQVNTRTRSMLLEAERLLGRQLGITQGSYSSGWAHPPARTTAAARSTSRSAASPQPSERMCCVDCARWASPRGCGPRPRGTGATTSTPSRSPTPTSRQVRRTRPATTTSAVTALANRGADDGPAVSPKRTWEEYQRTL